MHTLKSSAQLKADAREQLLGNYKTLVLAYLIMEFVISGCMSIVQSQLNLQAVGGSIIYYAVYFILVLFSAVFTAGQSSLYLKLARGESFCIRDIWYPFRSLADKCLLMQLIIVGKTFLCGIPFMISVVWIAMTKNYYLSLVAAAALIFFAVSAMIITIHYSQIFFLVLDEPDLPTGKLLAKSKSLMKGHVAGYFYLLVSFIGVLSLSVLTFGIASLWIYPYFMSVKANYYLDLTKPSSQQQADLSMP